MRYLLDVNVLLAMYYEHHVHHARVERWLANAQELASADSPLVMATCSITELGFVRLACGATKLATSAHDAKRDLREFKLRYELVQVSDERSALELPEWVERSPQTTDGHLVELAAEHGLRLLTLDERIPGAELVPHIPGLPLTVREESFLDEQINGESGWPAWQSTGSTGLWLE